MQQYSKIRSEIAEILHRDLFINSQNEGIETVRASTSVAEYIMKLLPPPSSHQGDLKQLLTRAFRKGWTERAKQTGIAKKHLTDIYLKRLEAIVSNLLEESQPAPPTPVEGPTPTIWKEIEEELIECYEDYPAMNAEQDARKKIDEWKAKSQQELQGRPVWVRADQLNPKPSGLQFFKFDNKLDFKSAGRGFFNDNSFDGDVDGFPENEYPFLWIFSDSPAPEQVDVIDAYKEYVQLLTDELSELAGVAAVHGWKSTRHEKGVELRNKIESLQNKQG